MRAAEGENARSFCSTFQVACGELRLLLHDREWETMLQDAGHTQMCSQIRELFVILLFCDVTNPKQKFDTYHHQWWDDFVHRARTILRETIYQALLRTLVLCDIERKLLVNKIRTL
jgi:hypothetical protein